MLPVCSWIREHARTWVVSQVLHPWRKLTSSPSSHQLPTVPQRKNGASWASPSSSINRLVTLSTHLRGFPLFLMVINTESQPANVQRRRNGEGLSSKWDISITPPFPLSLKDYHGNRGSKERKWVSTMKQYLSDKLHTNVWKLKLHTWTHGSYEFIRKTRIGSSQAKSL